MSDRLADLKRYEQIRLESSLGCYKPYAKQLRFHELGREKRERMLMAANRYGKCTTASTLVDTSRGPLRMGDIYGANDVSVWSWNGRERILGKIAAWIRKPPELCYRITMSDGRWVECPSGHRILSRYGFVFVRDVLRLLCEFPLLSSECHRESISEHAQLIHGANDRHSSEIEPDCQGRYLLDCHPCDARLREAEHSVSICPPLSVDALLQHGLSLQRDDWGNRCTNIQQHCADHHATRDDARRSLDLSAWHTSLAREDCVQSLTDSLQVGAQSPVAEYPDHVEISAVPGLDEFFSWMFPPIEGNRIVSFSSVGVHDLLDLQVENYRNYFAAGLVNHNTICAASEVAFHLLGQYPQWWPGIKLIKPGRWGIGSKTAELTRDGAQKMLLGPFGRFGTGTIPKAALLDYKLSRGIPESVDIFRVRHSSGGIAEGVLKAYADGREKWQADEWQGVWLDEEAPEDIYSEASARTAVTSGPILNTLTPLLGMSNVVRRFYPDQGHPDRGLVIATLDEAEHFDAESRRKTIESYLPHERDARTKGIPMLGEGAVYPISEDMIAEDLFDIPAWWPQLIAMDFGWHDHPTAAVKIAWDRDNDCVHITACYKQSKQPLVVYAAGIKAMGEHPVAWPHDGLMHDKSSGTQIAQLYKQQGLRMLSEHAQFPDDRKNGTEAAVWEALARMQTNRLKVARHLSPWFEECRSYHRKDGKVVPEHDDLMKATHYGLMMLRYAEAGERAPQKDDRYSRRRTRHHSWLTA